MRKFADVERVYESRLMQVEVRSKVAAAQRELIRALVSNGELPPEFDCSRVRAAADALLQKRAKSVARVWPGLAHSLGASFHEQFSHYAEARPVLRDGGPLADGREFARLLSQDAALSDDAIVEVLTFDLRYRVAGSKVVARRGLSFCAGLLKQSHRLIVAVRLPITGERWIRFPLKIL